MVVEVDLSAGPDVPGDAETMKTAWKSAKGKKLKGFGSPPGRAHMDISVQSSTEDASWKSTKASRGYASGRALREEKSFAQAEMSDTFVDKLFKHSPYHQDLCQQTRRKARRKEAQMQKSESEPTLRSSRHSPVQHASPRKDGGRAAHSNMKRSRSQPRQDPHRLPSLPAPGGRGGSDHKKNTASQDAADRQPLMSLSLPQISPSAESLALGGSSASLMAESICEPNRRRPRSALRQISSTALSISAELDKTMRNFQRFEERTWASTALDHVEEGGEELDEVPCLLGVSGRLSVSLDTLNTPTGRSVLNSQDGSSTMERQISKGSRSSQILMVEMVEEQGLDEARMRGAFLHFVEPGTFDLSIDNLTELLRFVGHPVVNSTEAAVREIVRDVTSYEYLDFDEFISFIERYVDYEKQYFHEEFKRYDDDESGELDTHEMRHLIKEVGIMGLNGMFKEAMSLVDVDGNGTLDFEEFLKFLKVYQRNEGFTADEVEEIMDIIDLVRSGMEEEGHTVKDEEGIPIEYLDDVLVRFFGMHARFDARKLKQELTDRHILHNPHSPPSFQLKVKEVLLYGRRMREMYYDELKNPPKTKDEEAGNSKSADKDKKSGKKKAAQVTLDQTMNEIKLYDANGNKKISMDEMRKALKGMQYEPLTVVLLEILNEVLPQPWEEGRELEFDEFFDFLLLYRQREGFLKSEVEALKGVFHTFDEDCSGDVNTLELGDVFRYIGYSLSVDELKKMVLVVDEDRSNELNLREFMRLMGLHRNSVIRDIREAFNMHVDLKIGVLPRKDILSTLARLGYKNPPNEVVQGLSNEPIDFDSFVGLTDECHRIQVSRQRKQAGFSDTELDNILELFRRFDKDGSGDIDCSELQAVFKAFGWAPKTSEEQEEIYGRLDRARALAREAGVEDTTDNGCAEIREWEFVQLARMIRRQQETAEERNMARLAHELKFSMPEVNEFRDIFLYSIQEYEDSDEEEDEDGQKKEGALARESVRRLVRKMGVRFTPESKDLLDKEMEVLGKGNPTLDFQAFLHLMRWLIDTDFGGIGSGQTEKKKKEK